MSFPTVPYDFDQWFSIRDAADRLGLTELAVRRHVHAGSLQAKRDSDGWKVFLPAQHLAGARNAGRGGSPDLDTHSAGLSHDAISQRLEDIEEGRRPSDSLHDTVIGPLLDHNASLVEKSRALEREVGRLQERERVLSEQIMALQREIAEMRAVGGHDSSDPMLRGKSIGPESAWHVEAES